MTKKQIELHEITQKAMTANIESAKSTRIIKDVTYIKLVINAAKPHIDNEVCDEIFDENRLGVFLFHEDKRYAVLEVWLSLEGDLIEVNRATKTIKPIKHAYAFKNYGIDQIAHSLADALDAISVKKKTAFEGNLEGRRKHDLLLGGKGFADEPDTTLTS